MISQVQIATIHVGDQDRASKFYTEKLGFSVVRNDPMGDRGRWIELATADGPTHVVLFTPPGMESRVGSLAPVGFTSPDIRKTCEMLTERGVEFVQPPERQPWGGTMALFKESEGNTIVLHD